MSWDKTHPHDPWLNLSGKWFCFWKSLELSKIYPSYDFDGSFRYQLVSCSSPKEPRINHVTVHGHMIYAGVPNELFFIFIFTIGKYIHIISLNIMIMGSICFILQNCLSKIRVIFKLVWSCERFAILAKIEQSNNKNWRSIVGKLPKMFDLSSKSRLNFMIVD